MSTVAIILARGGSKRIPRKNVRPFRGRPMLAYPIAAARESGLFDEVMVSTEDAEIADVARTHGASVPFLRSAAAASDFATTVDVLAEVLDAYRERGRAFTRLCCLYATAAFVTPDMLRRGAALLTEETHSVLPVVPFTFPIQRSLVLRDGRVAMRWPENLNVRSQDLEPCYHDVGQFYWAWASTVTERRALLTERTAALMLAPAFVQDIDNEDDWAIAEMKHEILARRAASGGATS